MSRFNASDVIARLEVFEGDYDDALEAYTHTEGTAYDDNGNAVTTFVITPVLEDEDGEYAPKDEEAERFRVKVIKL